MLHYLVFAIFVILFIRNFEKTSILVAALACWLTMFRDPLKLVSNLALTLFLISSVWGLFKYRKQLSVAPFLWCAMPVLLSYTVTMHVHGFHPKQYLIIVAQYMFPCILYCIINTQKRLNLFVKYASGLLILATMYCFVEEYISANPIMHWCENHPSSFTWLIDRTEHRFGFKRAQSFFSYEPAFGLTCTYIFIILFTLMRDGAYIMKTSWRKLLVFLLPICVFLTGTRSVVLCFIVACVSLLTPHTIRKYRFPLFLICLVLMLFVGSYFESIYDSIFVDSAELGGSSSDMREGQWNLAFYYMGQNFWFGNGIGFTGQLMEQDIAGLFGAEGMWLPIMMDRGMIGVIGGLTAFIIGLCAIVKRKNYKLIWLWVSFLLLKTITTGVGIEPTYYEIILVVLFRYAEFYMPLLYKKKNVFNFNNNPCL